MEIEINTYFFFTMLLISLLLIPVAGMFSVLTNTFNSSNQKIEYLNQKNIKTIALITSIINLFVSLIIFILFDFSSNQYQFVQEHHELSNFNIYLGVDGLSIYFVLLTTIITPIALLSN